MSEKQELRKRVEAKKKRLEARAAELEADASAEARSASEKIDAELAQLRERLRGGWDDLGEAAAAKLNDWLKDD